MHVIPVLDILNRQVVHGTGGDRAAYQPVRSIISASSDPIDMVAAFVTAFDFGHFYIADLNALESKGSSITLISALASKFPNRIFWIDGGFQKSSEVDCYRALKNIRPIIATESLTTLDAFRALTSELNDNSFVLSLDHKDGRLGCENIFDEPELWPNDVIVMDLNGVGKNQGVSLDLIAEYQRKAPRCNYYAAGGVRHVTDLQNLAQCDLAGALIASALHSGAITKSDLAKFNGT